MISISYITSAEATTLIGRGGSQELGRAFICLADETLYVETQPREVSPLREVATGLVRRYEIPSALSVEATNGLLDELAPLAQRVSDGHTIDWGISDLTGALTEDAQAAEHEIRSLIDDQVPPLDTQAIPVFEWDEVGVAYRGITSASTDADLDAIEAEIHSELTALYGVDGYRVIDLPEGLRELRGASFAQAA